MSSPEQVLSRPQRNDLFRALERSGALVNDFQLNVGRNGLELYIIHSSSGSLFRIGIQYTAQYPGQWFRITGTLENGDPAVRTTGELHFREKVGIPVNNEGFASLHPQDLTWEQVVPVVGKWALAVAEESREYEATPDLWAEFKRGRQLFSAPSENTPFSAAERERIFVQIQQIKVFITDTYELSADQLSEVNKRLDKIEESSSRLDRNDWLMAGTGAVFSLILSDLIPPQAAQHILMLIISGLGHLFGLGGPPAPLP